MKWNEMIQEFYNKLLEKPINKWVKIAIMIVTITIAMWVTTNCATQYVHRCAALSNNDTIEIIHEYHGDVKKR